MMRATRRQWEMVGGVFGLLTLLSGVVYAQNAASKPALSKNNSVDASVVAQEDFTTVMTRMQSAKAAIQQRHLDLLKERYDLGDHPAPGVTMARKKPVQEQVRVRLAEGQTSSRSYECCDRQHPCRFAFVILSI